MKGRVQQPSQARANSRANRAERMVPVSVFYCMSTIPCGVRAERRCGARGARGALGPGDVCSGFICWPWPRTRAGWMKDAFLGAGSPASSLPCYIGDPHPKSQKSSKYSLFSLETQASRSALPSGLASSSPVVADSQSVRPAFAAVLVKASLPFCVLPLRMYSSPLFPLCVSEYHDYFMLLSLFLVISLW
jgi:hypothetical protein